jgi:hypothetical protein
VRPGDRRNALDILTGLDHPDADEVRTLLSRIQDSDRSAR